jgi:serine protease Do
MALAIALLASGALAPSSRAADGRDQGWVGIYIQGIDADLKESENLPSIEGVYVVDVLKDSPAQKAGLQKGDVILQFGDQTAKSVRGLTRDIERCKPGDAKTLVIRRDGAEKTVTVVIGKGSSAKEFFWADEGEPVSPSDDPDFDVEVPDPPHVYGFSLGQLSNSRIGVSLYELSDQLAEYFGAKDGGALINEVVKDGPADKAGLQAGDVIVQVDHKPVENVADIRQRIQKKDGGDIATITVLRKGNEERTVDVTVEESDTWSGIGDNRFFRVRPHAANRLMDDLRPAMRKAQRAFRGSQQDLREEMDKLRQELDELRKELREKGK